MEVIAEFKDVTVSLRKEVLHSISWRLNANKAVALVGPNGAGKTTLIKTLLRIIRPSAGSITLLGKDIRDYSQIELGRLIGYVPQRATFTYPYTVREFLWMSRYPFRSVNSRAENCAAVEKALSNLNLSELENASVTQLSGGELQRVMIAGALVQNPKILLLDEPTNSLDPKQRQQVLNLINRIIEARNCTIILVTHELAPINSGFDHILGLNGGSKVFDGAFTPEFFGEDYKRVFEIPFSGEV